jgi:phospholipid/cholesterol/gamma-HCH transport system substrate-binding protein
MPRTRSLAWSELKIGIIAVAALALAAMLILAVGGGAGGLFGGRYELKTRFANVQGLKSGAVVRVAGVEVGKVEEVAFSGSEVEVRMQVNDDMKPRITSQSVAAIGSLSLLGEPVIDISPSSEGTPLEDGGFVPSGRAAGQISDVAAGATESLEQLTAMLRDIRAGRGTVGRLFSDDELYKEITGFVAAAEGVAAGLREGQGTLGQLVRNPAAYQRLNASLENLQDMTRRINAGEGSLGRLLNDDALAKSMSSAADNFDRVSARLNSGDNTVGKLLTEKELYERLNSLAARVDSLTAGLASGEGTAGQLLHDKQLYENMNAAATELRSLIGDIRKDPRKYLNVRVSIF